MSNVRFTLRTPNGTEETAIHLIYRIKGEKLIYPLGIKINPKHWNKKTQRVRNIANAKNKVSINTLLNDLDTLVTNYVNECIIQGLQLTKQTIKNRIDLFFNPVYQKEIKLLDFVNTFIEEHKTQINPRTGRTIAKTTITSLNNTYTILQKFEKEHYKLTFDKITLDFYNDFVSWCNLQLYALNTTGKFIKNLKVFMNAAHERGLTNNTAFKSKYFVKLSEEVDNIYLKEYEIKRIYKLDLSNNHTLENARDLFIIGALTGLRVSDWHKITTNDIIRSFNGSTIKIKTKKTDTEVIIPLNPIVSKIIEKYKGKEFKSMSEPKINKAIKEIGKMANITEYEYLTTTIGGKKVQKKYKRYELITTHTARRSFCSNGYLCGIDKLDLMQISGHTTETAFLKYIKVSKQEHAEKMAKHDYFTKFAM